MIRMIRSRPDRILHPCFRKGHGLAREAARGGGQPGGRQLRLRAAPARRGRSQGSPGTVGGRRWRSRGWKISSGRDRIIRIIAIGICQNSVRNHQNSARILGIEVEKHRRNPVLRKNHPEHEKQKTVGILEKSRYSNII